MPDSLRIFLAVPLEACLQQQLSVLQRRLGDALPGVRWARPETIHLTLRFFAGVTQEDLEKIKDSVLSVKRLQRVFKVEAKGLGVFPDPVRPRVLWLGLEPVTPLQELYRHCQTALTRAGLPPEPRPFRPHLTLGRWREAGPDLRRTLRGWTPQAFGPLEVRQLVVYQSHLHPDGARHDPLLRVDLPATAGTGR